VTVVVSAAGLNAAGAFSSRIRALCPLWVKSRRVRCS